MYWIIRTWEGLTVIELDVVLVSSQLKKYIIYHTKRVLTQSIKFPTALCTLR
jgi:hypothetical protein